MPAFDSAHLLELLRGHTRIPAVPGFEDEDCLRDLTAVLHGYILPLVKSEWQEHWLAAESATTNLVLVSGQAEYELPRRTVAGSVRTALLVSSSPANKVPLEFAEIDKVERWGQATGIPQYYAVRSNRVVLYPTPTATVAGQYTLRLPMLVRPARLALVDDCAEITATGESGAGTDITIAGIVSGVTDVLLLDVVRGQEPFENVVLEVQTQWSDFTTATLVGVAPGTVQVGDYLCPVGEAPFPQCPVELLDLLALRTTIEQLAGGGDTDVAGAKAASLKERRSDAGTTVQPRTGDPRHQLNGMAKWRFGNGTMSRLTNRGGFGL